MAFGPFNDINADERMRTRSPRQESGTCRAVIPARVVRAHYRVCVGSTERRVLCSCSLDLNLDGRRLILQRLSFCHEARAGLRMELGQGTKRREIVVYPRLAPWPLQTREPS